MHNHFHSNPDLRPAGERFFVRSEAGEDVPLRRIRLSDTPECFGGGRNPDFFMTDVTAATAPPMRARRSSSCAASAPNLAAPRSSPPRERAS